MKLEKAYRNQLITVSNRVRRTTVHILRVTICVKDTDNGHGCF